MTLTQKGDYWYGTSAEDIKAEIARYSGLNEYPAGAFADAICRCGARVFCLKCDDTEGIAQRVCDACDHAVFIGDSEEYVAEAKLEPREYLCGEMSFEIVVGIALCRDSKDIRWSYVGCRCTDCGNVGVYVDWKCNGGDAAEFLTKV